MVAAIAKWDQYRMGAVPAGGVINAKWFNICLVEAELLGSIVLLAGVFQKASWFITLAWFSALTLVSLAKGLAGKGSCGCLGRLIEVNPFLMAAFDISIVASLLRWRPAGHPRYGASRLLVRRALAALAWTTLGIPAAYTILIYNPTIVSDGGDVRGGGALAVLEPERWVGKRFPLLKHIDDGRLLEQGDWIVVLFRHDCDDCRAAILRYQRIVGTLAKPVCGRRMMLVEMPPYGEREESRPRDERFVAAKLANTHDWFAKTPVEMVLKDGIVVFAIEGGKGMPWLDRD